MNWNWQRACICTKFKSDSNSMDCSTTLPGAMAGIRNSCIWHVQTERFKNKLSSARKNTFAWIYSIHANTHKKHGFAYNRKSHWRYSKQYRLTKHRWVGTMRRIHPHASVDPNTDPSRVRKGRASHIPARWARWIMFGDALFEMRYTWARRISRLSFGTEAPKTIYLN